MQHLLLAKMIIMIGYCKDTLCNVHSCQVCTTLSCNRIRDCSMPNLNRKKKMQSSLKVNGYPYVYFGQSRRMQTIEIITSIDFYFPV